MPQLTISEIVPQLTKIKNINFAVSPSGTYGLKTYTLRFVHYIGVGSVALTIDPLCFIEIPAAASEAKVTSVAIDVCWVGILTSVVSQSGLVRALFAVGHICLVQVGLDHIRFRTEGRIVKVTLLSSEPVHLLLYEAAAAVELALCGASTRSSVVKLSVV